MDHDAKNSTKACTGKAYIGIIRNPHPTPDRR